MVRTAVVLAAGTLLALSSVPAAARATVDRRATPTMTVTVWPRYPQPRHDAVLTIRVGGVHGPATGWVRVRFDGALVAGCTHLVLHRGVTTCTAPATYAAKRTFVSGYKGSTRYRPRALTVIARS